jgi:hypothetical protein
VQVVVVIAVSALVAIAEVEAVGFVVAAVASAVAKPGQSVEWLTAVVGDAA